MGLIPAHAGKTWFNYPQTGHWLAHPRACGENSTIAFVVSAALGSSPRMRGKLADENGKNLIRRLIPAHAGKTSSERLVRAPVGAHPRACGENLESGSERIIPAGSSPRMRGKPCTHGLEVGIEGLIPAHAGKTTIWAAPLVPKTAHPRACGENGPCGHGVWPLLGSSPRMRGKR